MRDTTMFQICWKELENKYDVCVEQSLSLEINYIAMSTLNSCSPD